jgi:hypothetical protein
MSSKRSPKLNRSPKLRARLRACCTVHSPVGFAVTPPRCIRRVPCSMNTRTCSLLRSTVSTCRKSTATIPPAWACRNCRQPGPERRGAGSMPAECRICHTVDGATVTPSFMSSPWIRRCPHSGFSLASRTTRRAMPGTFAGRPGLRRLLVSVFFAASLRCQASTVAGATGKTSAQRLRGTSRASAANQARSAASYRTRPACRRSTAFSRRSTSSSPSFARSPRNARTARPSTRHVSRWTILSSTRQANQPQVKPAGGSAGQPLNRVSERYRAPHQPRGSRGPARDTGPGLPGRCHAGRAVSGRTAVRRQ